MKLDKKYLILIIILIAAIGSIVWTAVTSPRLKELIESRSTAKNEVIDQTETDDAESLQTSDAAAQSESGKASGIEVQTEADNTSATDMSDSSDDIPQDTDTTDDTPGGLIVEQDGDLVIIVPDGEDTFGE